MTGKQPRSNRRSFARGVLTVAGAGTIAGCAGDSGSTEDGESSGLEESDTGPAGNGSDIGDSESAENNSSDPEEEQDEEEQTPQWEKNTRNGIPLNGLGAYTDQMLEAGPVAATKAETINDALEEAQTVEEEREALVEELSEENYESLFSEYHRVKGKRDNAENSVVLNRNWSFTSDSEPIFEFYLVEDGELQSQPIILDPDPAFNNRQVNRPGQEDPNYLSSLRDDGHAAAIIPQDYDAIGERLLYVDEKHWPKLRGGFQEKWSYGLFGVGDHNILPHDRESSNVVFDGMYHGGDTQAVVDLNNQYGDSDLFNTDTVVSAEFTENGWEFHKLPDYEMGEPLPGEK